MKENIYNMQLHKEKRLEDGTRIVRVPGGWIYTFFEVEQNYTSAEMPYTENYRMNSVFVPIHNEFQLSEDMKGE